MLPLGYSTVVVTHLFFELVRKIIKFPWHRKFFTKNGCCKEFYLLFKSSVFRLPSSVFRLPSSVFRLPSSVFRLLFDDVTLSSVMESD
jgi:hypothetical protein